MSSNAYAPLGTPANEFLGPGAIYFDYGEETEVVIGATKGGGEFTDNAEFHEREADGDMGPVKGAVDLIKMRPVLKVKALKIDYTNLQKYFAGMYYDSSDSTYHKLTRMTDLDDSYLTNVAFVGQNRSGLDIVIILYDALGLGALKAAFTKDEEIVPEIEFTATFDPDTFDRDDADTYPYQVWLQKASDTTAPTISSVDPADTETDVAIDSNVVWTFSEAIKPVDVNSKNFFVIKSDGTAVAGALTIGTNDTVVTFNPTANLANATDYIAIATKHIRDTAGNYLAANSVTNFTTVGA